MPFLDTNFKPKVTIYKADQKTNIYYIIGFVILFGLTIPLSSKFTSNSWTLPLIFLLLFLVFNFVTSRLNEVWLDKPNSNLTLLYKNYVGVKRKLKYDLDKIEFTYKRQATSFRGGIKNICTIYYSGKKVTQLIPDNDDWSDDEIRSFVYGLLETGVKKKFVGYSLKDVET
ncbi:hypothetical protein IQ13_3317 [Lacibacter cauensis]|uniref:PH (Pleckstrin Homology) domain-containing protein n=1 Tax=Lacibacter cauensis TaxID=510947 RepID=A0A562SHN6_9BACT|nr:hypothetical protein [Lacibacter cauensis]TWI80638.1 hypothetical protein IQ13_3317 [Lacibacter cauensis]